MFDLSGWAQAAVGGSMPLALPVALLAGLVSFFSPCVVPLLPGYLSYATGMSAAQVVSGKAHRGRMLVGTALFVLGFAVVFVAAGITFGVIGMALVTHQVLITRVVGVVSVVMGLMFAGVIPSGPPGVASTADSGRGTGRRTAARHRVRAGLDTVPWTYPRVLSSTSP